jgi:hypothetical protein
MSDFRVLEPIWRPLQGRAGCGHGQDRASEVARGRVAIDGRGRTQGAPELYYTAGPRGRVGTVGAGERRDLLAPSRSAALQRALHLVVWPRRSSEFDEGACPDSIGTLASAIHNDMMG